MRRLRPAPPDIPADQVWRRPKASLGYPEGLRGRGGIPSPLLAGFALSAIATLLTADSTPPLADWAVLAFAGAVALLLHSMQLTFFALSTDPSPDTYLMWNPEARVDSGRLEEVRRAQITKYDQMVSYWLRSNITYDLGLNAFLTGLVLLLVPDDWTGSRIAALAVAGVAMFLEVWWGLANRDEITKALRLPHPVEVDGRAGNIEPLSDLAKAAVMDRVPPP